MASNIDLSEKGGVADLGFDDTHGRAWCHNRTRGRARSGVSEVDILFAGVPVADFKKAVDWYGRLFGRAADVIVTNEQVVWRLGDAAWIYVVSDDKRAGRALLTLCVADLDGALSEITGRGVSTGPVATVGTGRKAVIIDPDGNSLSFIEVSSSPQ